MNRYTGLERYQREARRLRAEYAHDLAVRALVAADLAIRGVAVRVAAWIGISPARTPDPATGAVSAD